MIDRLHAAVILLALATPFTTGCSVPGDDEGAVEATEATSADALTTADNVSRALAYGQSLVGTPYGWWFSGPLPAGEPMWTAGGPAPSAAYVRARSTNCAGLLNLMLRSVGKPLPSTPAQGVGGTGAYGAYYARVAKRFDPNRNYPAGTLIGRYYRDTYDQGHVAVVLGNGRVLQSFANFRGGAYPGVNTTYTVAQSHAGYFYEYAVLPEDWLGGQPSECRFGDGMYCGGNGVSGEGKTLYRCQGGKATAVRACTNACVREAPGVDDYCATTPTCAYGDGLYCGDDGVGAKAGSLYRCKGGRVTFEEDCPGKCVHEAANVDDHCG